MKSEPKALEELSHEIEMRLHRVMIKLDSKNIKCPYSKNCNSSQNCSRCNEFYTKCWKFKEHNLNSL